MMSIDRESKSSACLKARFLAAIGSSMLVGMITQPALAQDTGSEPSQASASAGGTLDDIIVTARRRDEKLQDVPQAVSVMTQDQLQRELVRDQNDLQQKVPSLSIAKRFGNSGGTYGMRGLSGQSSSTPTVGTYFAEVPSPTNNLGLDTSAGQSLYDLQSVQVLKGPQGTLFGRTSTAGAVLVTPAAPDLIDYKGNGSLSLGTYGLIEGTLALSVPVIRDVLAIRVAANYNHRRGYTRIIGSDQRLDGLNNDSQRLSVLFQPADWLKNTTIYDRYNSDQSAGSYIAVDYNPNFPLFNLPASTTFFNAACAAAVGLGQSPNVATCVSQRLAILASTKANLASEAARTANGGDELRRTNSGNSGYYIDRSTHQTVINRTEVELPELGALQLRLKNIFGYQHTTGFSTLNVAGVPDDLLLLYVGVGTGLSANQSGNGAIVSVGPGEKFYSNETQISGTLFGDRLTFIGGYYYQHAPSTQDLVNLGTLQKSLGGVATLNLGWSAGKPFTVGGRANQNAFYGQATLGLDGILDGVHLTAGVRRTKDDFLLLTQAATSNPVTGVFTPSGVTATQALKTSGTNYNFSLDYKATPDLLFYVATRKGYVPGGLNNPSGTGAPNFKLVYDPESIKDIEAGTKWDFNTGGVRGRLNVAVYDAKYSGIQRSFTAITGGTVASYVANVAKAKLRGIEVELTLLPVRNLTIGANYSFNETKYKEWIGADPYGAAPAGTNVDLKNNPFLNAPRHKFNINATYEMPLSGDDESVSVTGQFTYQSRAYYQTASERYIEIFGERTREAISAKPYGIFNARIDWQNPLGQQGVRASLFVRNAFDVIYTTSATPLNNSLGFSTKQFGEPRIMGAGASFSF